MPETENGAPIGSGFTEGELQFASFWVKNKIAIRKAVYAFLALLNVLFWGYAFWGFIDAYALSYPRESRIPQEIAANELVAKRLSMNRPINIQVRPVRVLENTDGRLDMIVPVENPNAQWVAEFTYRFNVSGELTPVRSGFLLPGEKTYLGAFGFAQKKAGGKSAVITVDNLRWKRLDPAVVGSDFPAWLERRNAFQVSDIEQSRDIVINGKKILRTTFTFANPTAYGYWNIGLIVVLKRGDVAVAANELTLSNVVSGDSRDIAIDWFEPNLPQVTDTEIIPVVNYLDPGAYLPSSQ